MLQRRNDALCRTAAVASFPHPIIRQCKPRLTSLHSSFVVLRMLKLPSFRITALSPAWRRSRRRVAAWRRTNTSHAQVVSTPTRQTRVFPEIPPPAHGYLVCSILTKVLDDIMITPQITTTDQAQSSQARSMASPRSGRSI